MNEPENLKHITKFSKILATLLFILLPFIGFVAGMKYGYVVSNINLSKLISVEDCQSLISKLAKVTTGSQSNASITVSYPLPNQVINSPLTITGQARGSWYFEGVFPIKLLDSSGNVLAQTQAHSQGEWTTNDFVAFTAQLTFTNPTGDTGTLVLEKDNPSGMPQNAGKITIPVNF